MTFLLLLTLLQSSPAPTPPNPQQNLWAAENEYFRAMKDDVSCAAANASCKDRVILALGDIAVKSGGKTRNLKRGQVAVFAAGQSYEKPTGDHFWEIVIKPDHPPTPAPKEVIQPEGNDVLHEGEDFWIYNEKLVPGETRARHSHTFRAVVQLNASVGDPGGAVLEWPTPSRPPAYTATPLKLTPAQQAFIVKNPPRSNDSIALVGPVIHTNKASQYGPLNGVVVMMKSADEKAGGKKAFNTK